MSQIGLGRWVQKEGMASQEYEKKQLEVPCVCVGHVASKIFLSFISLLLLLLFESIVFCDLL